MTDGATPKALENSLDVCRFNQGNIDRQTEKGLHASLGAVTRSGIHRIAFRNLAGLGNCLPPEFSRPQENLRLLADNKDAIRAAHRGDHVEKILTHRLRQSRAVVRRKMRGETFLRFAKFLDGNQNRLHRPAPAVRSTNGRNVSPARRSLSSSVCMTVEQTTAFMPSASTAGRSPASTESIRNVAQMS